MTSLTYERPLRLLRAYPREAAIALGALAFSAAAMAGVAHLSPSLDGAPVSKPAAAAIPVVPEMTVQPLAPDQAVEINKEIPVTAAAGPAAAPFSLGKANAAARQAALTCLTQSIYYEAARETEVGQRAVAQVVLNRVRHPAFPASVCGVVYQGSTRPTGCQFTFTCDGSLAHQPNRAIWNRARQLAWAALQGSVYPDVGNATHYHANYVVPTWASSLAKTGVVGAHLFYRWSGNWGQPGAFGQRYNGREASAETLRKQALTAHAGYLAAGTPTAAGNPAVKMAQVDGLPVTQQPDGRVTVKFTPEARAAVEAAIAKPRTDAAPAMGNVLDAGTPSSSEKPLGAQPAAQQPAEATPNPPAAGARQP